MLRLAPVRMLRVGKMIVQVDVVVMPALALFAWTSARNHGVAVAMLFTAGLVITLVAQEAARVVAAVKAGARVQAATVAILANRTIFAPTSRAAEIEWRSALAGPLAVILLGFLAFTLAAALGPLAPALRDLSQLQLVYGAVCAVPAFPFDGGRALRGLAARRLGSVAATRLTASAGKTLAVACVAVGLADRQPMLLFAALLFTAGALANEPWRHLATRPLGGRARDAAEDAPTIVSVHQSIERAVMELACHGACALPVITTDGAVVAAFTIDDARRVRARARAAVTVGDVLPLLGGVISEDAPLHAVRRLLAETRRTAVPAVDASGGLVGIVVLEAIDRLVELGELYESDVHPPTPAEEAPRTTPPEPSP